MKLSQAKDIIEATIDNNLNLKNGRDAQYVVPYLVGGAGLGKTTVVSDIAKERGLELNILSLAQYDAGELAGWPVPDKDGTNMIRLRPDWMPEDGEGILFLDELPQAPVSNQNIAAQIINERRVGRHKMPEGWVIVSAGNKSSDRAGTNMMPTHLRDRLMFLNVEASLEDTIAYYYSKKVDEKVCAYLRFRPEFLHKFDKNEDACPSPRSWERVSSILSWKLDEPCRNEAIAGQVGTPAMVDFIGFLKLQEACPDIDELISNPDNATIPSDPAILYAVCASLSSRINKSNAKGVMQYLNRLPHKEFTVFAVRDALSRDPDLKRVDAVKKWIISTGKSLIL